MKFTPLPPQVSYPELESEMLDTWEKEQTFKRSLARNPQERRFTFYDGPPFATGLPHYGHILQGAIKDVIPRFKTMQGYFVERRFGWDCHGLPVEVEVEKELGISSRQEILDMGVAAFNDACRAIVLRYTAEWEQTTKRLGRWIDFENDYKTMDTDYMESIWWVVKELHEKGLLYEGHKAMHICPRCATPLSNFEVGLAYRDRVDESVYALFPLDDGVNLVAWTTTPWTLPGNVLLAVNPNLTYVEVEHEGQRYIVAEDRLAAVFGEGTAVVARHSAKDLRGRTYDPPFRIDNLEGRQYEVVESEVVSSEEGTGILHVAPAFGEEDLAIGQREQAAFIQHVDMTGKVRAPVEQYAGQSVLEVNSQILADLKHAGRVLRTEKVTHQYPHCWRCDTPLLNYATTSWFVAVTQLKERLITENQHINWMPDHVRDGRFGKWLEGARDWAISRNRFWGNPLPIWRCANNHLTVIGSRDELEKLSGQRPDDLHKQFVDEIEFNCPTCGKTSRRIEDVLDCWFESGSMPYAEQHYPFEHKKDFAAQYPADFIAEALDQTRGWFYTLHVLGVALRDEKAFQNVITTGLVLAEDGKKMSKRLKNYTEPEKLINRYGADAVRLYMLSSPVVRGDDLRFTDEGVEEVMKKFNAMLWNSVGFFMTYASVDGWELPAKQTVSQHVLDRWILSRLTATRETVTSALESYDIMQAVRVLVAFLEELSNWYIRRSRRRFWKTEDDADKLRAYETLFTVLDVIIKLSAPFAPFLSDYLYRRLHGATSSVHLADWPTPRASENLELEAQMNLAREVVRLGLAARSVANIKVRQPLQTVTIATSSSFDSEILDIIREELNVKDVALKQSADDMTETVLRPIPREIARLAKKNTQAVLEKLKSGGYAIVPDGYSVGDLTIPHSAVETIHAPKEGYIVETSSAAAVGVSTEVSPELRREGIVRDVIRSIQELRRSEGFAVSDRIELRLVAAEAEVREALEQLLDLLQGEVLAAKVTLFAEGEEEHNLEVGEHQLGATLTHVS